MLQEEDEAIHIDELCRPCIRSFEALLQVYCMHSNHDERAGSERDCDTPKTPWSTLTMRN